MPYQFDFTLDSPKYEPQIFCDLHKEANRHFIPDQLAAVVPLQTFGEIPEEMKPLTKKHFLNCVPMNIGTSTQLGLSESSFTITFYFKFDSSVESFNNILGTVDVNVSSSDQPANTIFKIYLTEQLALFDLGGAKLQGVTPLAGNVW